MKRLLFLQLFCFYAIIAFAQEKAKGYVFFDTNNNGIMDKKEKGLENIAVSNGRDVVITNVKGWYQLPVTEDDIIFVIKPAAYNTPLSAKKLPQFYYNHKPAGSPANFKYKGILPTGNLPNPLNFPLVTDTTKDNFTAIIFGDPQPANEAELEQFKKGIVDEAAGIKNARMGISLGDIVGNRLDLQSAYTEVMKAIALPWYNVMGNHDMNMDAKSDSLADESFELNFGPATYSFNIGKVHFIILDDIIYPSPVPGREYWGGFTEKQFAFIENDLKFVPKENLLILSMHIPLKSAKDAFRMEDRKKLFLLLKDFPNCLALSAHTHLQRNDFLGKKEDWLQSSNLHEYNAGTTSGDWYSGKLDEKGVPSATMRDGTRKGYAFLNITGNQYSIAYKVAGMPAAYQMEVYCPKIISTEKNTAGFYANYFMGSEADILEYKFNEGKWQQMNFTKSVDPTFTAELIQWDFTDTLMPGRRPGNAVTSTHLWQGNFPKKMKAGNYTLTIKVTDRYGKLHETQKAFRVEKSL